MDYLKNVLDWSFMNEPLWRWFMFLGALIAMMTAWRGVIDYIK